MMAQLGVRFPDDLPPKTADPNRPAINLKETYSGVNNQTQTSTIAGTLYNPASATNVINPRQSGLTARFDF